MIICRFKIIISIVYTSKIKTAKFIISQKTKCFIRKGEGRIDVTVNVVRRCLYMRSVRNQILHLSDFCFFFNRSTIQLCYRNLVALPNCCLHVLTQLLLLKTKKKQKLRIYRIKSNRNNYEHTKHQERRNAVGDLSATGRAHVHRYEDYNDNPKQPGNYMKIHTLL